MKKICTLLFVFTTIFCQAQVDLETLYNPELAPFYHGVASGDPLQTQVIIWTRVTPENNETSIDGSWQVASDAGMNNVVQSGTFTTDATRDFTVKIDVENLSSGQTYYYQFEALGDKSIIGRTKTAPEADIDNLRFAVVSCSNYQAGYFNAYGRIADRDDLDAVIHLGDYIYEYGNGGYGDSVLVQTGARSMLPDGELITLEDYRLRYATYRLDPDLRNVHQNHPFITVWDDHETANDSYKDGAQNHNDGEGDWQNRKAMAQQVYSEWLPIRGDAKHIYRNFSYGNLADVIMLDTRLEGRDAQIMDVTHPDVYAEDRTILGAEQREWLFEQLKNSTATWKILGNQVMFAEFNVGWAAQSVDGWTPEQLESIFLDIWDGYPAERQKVLEFLDTQNIDNVLVITGDVHSSFAYDLPYSTQQYNPITGEGSIAVEFVTPSITSSNYDERIGVMQAKMMEYQMNKPLTNDLGFPNPHMKYVDLTQHGYFILDLTPEKAQADWFYADDILEKNKSEHFQGGVYTLLGENRLQVAESPIKD